MRAAAQPVKYVVPFRVEGLSKLNIPLFPGTLRTSHIFITPHVRTEGLKTHSRDGRLYLSDGLSSLDVSSSPIYDSGGKELGVRIT